MPILHDVYGVHSEHTRYHSKLKGKIQEVYPDKLSFLAVDVNTAEVVISTDAINSHTWSEHIAYICKKISKSVGIIYRSRFCLLTNTKLMLYYTLIYPYLTYCNIVWAFTYPSNLTSLL